MSLNSRDAVHTLVNNFTNIIRAEADPLFAKHHSSNPNSGKFSGPGLTKQADWFDSECLNAKNRYINAMNSYNCEKTDVRRKEFCTMKQLYKTMINRKRRSFELNKVKEIESLRHSKPRQFWNLFRKRNKRVGDDIKIEEFKKYFSDLSSDIINGFNADAEDFRENHDFNNTDNSFEELDRVIEVSEVISAVKRLKRDKAIGKDCLLNEYFIECIDILASHLCDIFNIIIESGFFS